MIGDKDLGVMPETNSSTDLRQLVWQAATEKGYGKYFLEEGGPTDDDHMPFLQRGVKAVDLIDFNYGPDNSYWHTDQDTMDKLSAHSLQVVGNVVLETLRRLE
jgi:Zn-dependent M28 family amino/carboxypeptidase